MREDYVTLTLHQSEEPLFASGRKSVWRSWNQLSRLQRNLFSMLSVTIILFIIYLWKLHNYDEKYIVTNYQSVESSDSKLPLDTEKLLAPDTQTLLNTPSAGTTSKEPIAFSELYLRKFESDKVAAQENEILGDERSRKKTNREAEIGGKETPKSKVVFPEASNERQIAVVNAFRHAWAGYKQYGWGHDHLKPISGGHHDWFGLGLTIIDSLDTMYIMGLKKEFAEAREWVFSRLNLNEYNDVNLFEVTIRVLGGLLSAYHLTGDDKFLEKALDLGERLLPCFTRSPSAIPYSDVNLASHLAHSPRWGPDSSTSEVTTLQLEFRDLSRSTHDTRFEEAAAKVSWHVHTLPKTDGLVPIFINPKTGQFQNYADIKLGARGDSYYEYLVKQWIQTGKTQQYLRDDYIEAVLGIERHLAKRTANKKLLFIGELKGGTRDFVPKMDHLVCYLPGTLALGYHHGLPQSHMQLAEELMQTCYHTYSERPTFLAPEITYFNLQNTGMSDMYVKSNDAHNLLRPEFIESLWYLYQITGNTTYQNWGWNIFQAFEKYTKVRFGYTSIGNVNNPNDTKPRDMMESFFLGETLKYFYLLFSDDRELIDLDKYVVNTEAHPLPIYSS